MNDIPGSQPTTGRLGKFPQIRRFNSRHLRPTRSPLLNMAILIVIFAAIIFVVYKLGFDPRSWVKSEVVDLSQSVEQIQELSTVKSHLHFTVVVREEGGNVIVRNLADQSGVIGMDDIGSALFENPTMIVALHGIATYGVRLEGLSENVTQDDTTVSIALPSADVLDVKLVAADTKIVAQIKGLFRSSNQSLLNAATIRGEEFVRDFARQDTTLLELAGERARSLLQLIVERSGKRAVFVEGG